MKDDSLINVMLPAGATATLDNLVAEQVIGEDRGEIARFLLCEALLQRRRHLPKALADADDLFAAAPNSAHPDDVAIDEFAAAMKAKMALGRAKGRAGWQECDRLDLWNMLRGHVAKGDVRDIANFCMMVWHVDGKGENPNGR